MREFIKTHRYHVGTGAALGMALVLGVAGFAGATTYDPTTALTGLASSATSTASPIMVAVAVALIPLLIVFLVVGWVFGLFGKRRHV